MILKCVKEVEGELVVGRPYAGFGKGKATKDEVKVINDKHEEVSYPMNYFIELK